MENKHLAIRLNDSPAKPLSSLVSGLLRKRDGESTPLMALLTERLTLSEAIALATEIVGRYPNGGRDAGKSYLGALAETLCAYPKTVAEQCAKLNGVSAHCEFLPSVAAIMKWCDAATEPLRARREREIAVSRQLDERREFVREQTEARAARKRITQ